MTFIFFLFVSSFKKISIYSTNPTLALFIVNRLPYARLLWYPYPEVIKWKHFPRYWPSLRGIHWSPVNSLHKGQWRGASAIQGNLIANKNMKKPALIITIRFLFKQFFQADIKEAINGSALLASCEGIIPLVTVSLRPNDDIWRYTSCSKHWI